MIIAGHCAMARRRDDHLQTLAWVKAGSLCRRYLGDRLALTHAPYKFWAVMNRVLPASQHFRGNIGWSINAASWRFGREAGDEIWRFGRPMPGLIILSATFSRGWTSGCLAHVRHESPAWRPFSARFGPICWAGAVSGPIRLPQGLRSWGGWSTLVFIC